MFWQKHRRQTLEDARRARQALTEVERLRHRLAQLENALGDVIEASDDVLIDLRRHQVQPNHPQHAFADAWRDSDASTPELEAFFSVGQVDARARRWLLART